jgi:16S rRNA (guanine966-N2)-methyltransferase
LGLCSSEAFDLAFLDPPYRKGLPARALASLHTGNWLKPGALAIVETAQDEPLPEAEVFRQTDERDYGETRVAFYRYEP